MKTPTIFALLFLAVSLTAAAAQAVVYVDLNAPGPGHDGLTWDTAFLTIQEGVNAATPDGDVWVADGTYVENVVMGEGVQLYGGFLGAEPGGYETSLDQRDFVNNVTTINGNQSGSCVTMADGSRVDGFTITNGSGTQTGDGKAGGGVAATWLEPPGTIVNNVITRNSTDWGGGIACAGALFVTCNSITENATNWQGGGVGCVGYPPAIISNNTMADNTARRGGGGGVYCGWLSEPLVMNNVITGNSTAGWGGGIFCEENRGSPTLADNVITHNAAGAGGGISCKSQTWPVIIRNVIERNSAVLYGGGILVFRGSGPLTCTVASNAVAGNRAGEGGGGGIACYSYSSATVVGNTIVGNACEGNGGGLSCSRKSSPTLANNVIADNQAGQNGGGIWCGGDSTPRLLHSDLWANAPDDYYGCEPGEGDISADPMFVNPEGGNWHLSFGSPCVDAGTNDAPGLPETDWEGEPRVYDGDGDEEEYGVYATADMGADEFVPFVATAPDPQPECEGPLFGTSQAGLPAWVWFSIPIDPDSCCNGDDCYNPATVLGFPVSSHLWRWDKYSKTTQVYKTGFAEWDLAVGEGYLLFLWTDVPNPSYLGISPFTPWSFEHKLGRQGWTWIGMPGLSDLAGQDFMSSVKVKYPSDETGCYRTGAQDYEAIPDNWIAWGWPYWNTWLKCMEVFTPYAPFGHRTCYPWLGYRVWVKVGTAADPDEADQVTLIWPKVQ